VFISFQEEWVHPQPNLADEIAIAARGAAAHAAP